MEAPTDEELTDTEMREAWFKLVEAAHRGQPKPGAANPAVGLSLTFMRGRRCGLSWADVCLNGPAQLLPDSMVIVHTEHMPLP